MEKQDSSTHESESGTTPIVERRRPYYPKFLRPRIVISGIVIAIVLATGLYYGIPYIEYQIDRRAKFSETEVTDGRPPFPEEEMPGAAERAAAAEAARLAHEDDEPPFEIVAPEEQYIEDPNATI